MDIQALDVVRQISLSHFVSRSLHVVAELDVAGVVPEGGADIAEVARKTGANADALGRVLRLLASRGIFRLDGDRVSNTAYSVFLRDDHPASLRPLIRNFGQDILWRFSGQLMHSVKTGESVAERVHPDGGLWGYRNEHPEVGAIFDAAMEAKARGTIAGILATYDFAPYRTVVDVGGGMGHLIRAIVGTYPTINGVLFDQPPVIERAKARAGDDRLSFVAGDFFATAIPTGDLFVLMDIIHDWDDDSAGKILQAVRRAMTPNSRVAIIEVEMVEGEGPHFSKLLDILMMVNFGARQRTNAQYEALLRANGFAPAGITRAGAEIVIVEGTPA